MVGGEGKEIAASSGQFYDSFNISSEQGSTGLLSQQASTGSVAVRVRELDGDDTAVFIGWDSDVTPDNGFPLEEGESISMDLDVAEQQLFASTDSEFADVRVIGLR